MNRRVLGARWAIVMYALTASLPSVARADGPPPADTTSLVPPDAQHQGPPSPGSPPVAPAELLPTRHPQRLAALLFAGTAVAGVAVGAAFGALALNKTSSWNSSNQMSATALSYKDLANQDSIVSDVGFGVAFIAGVTSVVLFLKPEETGRAGPASPPPPVSFTVAPILTAHTAGAGARFRF